MRNSVTHFILVVGVAVGVLTQAGCQNSESDTNNRNTNNTGSTKDDFAGFPEFEIAVDDPTEDENVTIGARLFTHKTDKTKGAIVVRMRVLDGWQLYSPQSKGIVETAVKVAMAETEGITSKGEWEFPSPTPDPDNKKKLWLLEDVIIKRAVDLADNAAAPKITINYQTCQGHNGCKAPIETEIIAEKK